MDTMTERLAGNGYTDDGDGYWVRTDDVYETVVSPDEEDPQAWAVMVLNYDNIGETDDERATLARQLACHFVISEEGAVLHTDDTIDPETAAAVVADLFR
jgi:hypothetical protein